MPEPENDDAGRDVDLRADGLLWLINRTVFHPRGYALGMDDGKATGRVAFTLYGDGSEPWRFEISDEVENALFEATIRVMPHG